MASRQMPVKRRLPAWMEVVHQHASSHSGCQSGSSDVGYTGKFETAQKRSRFVISGELKDVDESATHCHGEEVQEILSVGPCAVTGVSRDEEVQEIPPVGPCAVTGVSRDEEVQEIPPIGPCAVTGVSRDEEVQEIPPIGPCAVTGVSRDEEVQEIPPVGPCSVTGVSRDATWHVSAAQVIEQSMQLLTFTGRVVYSCHYADCAGICHDILTSLSSSDPVTVGFDMEWPVSFHKGASSKTALIQLCLSEATCYLFHVSAMPTFPAPLKHLICDVRVVLVGLNIEADLWRLERDYDLRVKPLMDRGSVVDVGRLANQKLKSSEKWTLDGLCKNVLRKRLNKDVKLRCGDWSQVPLHEEQKLYASTDAYAGLLLHQCLSNK